MITAGRAVSRKKTAESEYIPDSMLWALKRTEKLLFGGQLSESLQRIPYAQMPYCQSNILIQLGYS